MGDLLPVNFFPEPVDIQYISLAYNGVTYFSAALHAGYFFSEITYMARAWVASHADVLRGIREECLTNVTNCPLISP